MSVQIDYSPSEPYDAVNQSADDYSEANQGPQLNDWFADFAGNRPETVSQRMNPLSNPNDKGANIESNDTIVAFVPRPPAPDVGGAVNGNKPLGYTKAIRTNRFLHKLFGGETLVVPTMGVHPVEGPVGFSNRTGRLALRNKVALNGDGMQTSDAVDTLFSNGYPDSSGKSRNPNYV